jgi:hypothetical protein
VDGRERNTYKILVRKPEGKRILVRPRHDWEDNMKIGLKEIGFHLLRIGSSGELL